jgi:hypothetical protein
VRRGRGKSDLGWIASSRGRFGGGASHSGKLGLLMLSWVAREQMRLLFGSDGAVLGSSRVPWFGPVVLRYGIGNFS